MHFSRRIEWCKQLSSKTFSLKFHILDPIFAPRPTWVIMDLWLQKYPGRLGTCPNYSPKPISQNRVSKIFRPGPPLKGQDSCQNKIKWSKVPPSHFSAVWRDKFSNHLNNLSRGNLRKATQFLTGHAALNYHLNKYKPHLISKNCPHCFADVENIGHYVGQRPK